MIQERYNRIVLPLFFIADIFIVIISFELVQSYFSIQYSCRRFPKPLDTIGRFLQLDNVNKKLFSNYLMKDFNHKENIDVDWVTGAMMMIRSKAFLDVGCFDEKSFFLYCEDLDLCKRMWLKKWRVHYVADNSAIHHHLRGGLNLFSRNFYFHLKSTINYYRKYGFV